MVFRLKDYFFNHRFLFVAIICYAISFGLNIFNDGIYWDDWPTYFNTKAQVLNSGREIGIAWASHLAYFFRQNDIIFLRLTTFACFLIPIVCIYKIGESIPEIDSQTRFLTTLFFGILPFNHARIVLSTVHYSVCYLMFFLAFWILSRYLKEKKLFLRVIALGLFFFSFFTNSFLVFFTLVVMYIAYVEGLKELLPLSLRQIGRTLSYADFICLPFLFFMLRNIYWTPHGAYAAYNQISLANLLNTPALVSATVLGSFGNLIIRPLPFSHPGIFLAVFTGLWLTVIRIKDPVPTVQSFSRNLLFFAGGIFTLFLGCMAYYAVGLNPSLTDWSSRHQLLMSLGTSIGLAYGLKTIFDLINPPAAIQSGLWAFLATFCILYNVEIALSFHKDWMKQEAIMQYFVQSETIRQNSTFLVEDHTFFLNANRREYRDYEYAGMFKKVFGDEKRFATSIERFDQNKDYRLEKILNRGFTLWNGTPPGHLIQIRLNHDVDAWKVTMATIFDRTAYGRFLKNLLIITVRPIEK